MKDDVLMRLRDKAALTPKSCVNCGKIFMSIPNHARPWQEPDGKVIGWLWECRDCEFKTTIFKIVIGE